MSIIYPYHNKKDTETEAETENNSDFDIDTDNFCSQPVILSIICPCHKEKHRQPSSVFLPSNTETEPDTELFYCQLLTFVIKKSIGNHLGYFFLLADNNFIAAIDDGRTSCNVNLSVVV